MRIESIRFLNFKLLRDTTLPLEPLTVIVGPNNSGKSSVLEALRAALGQDGDALHAGRSFGAAPSDPVRVTATLTGDGTSATFVAQLQHVPSSGWGVSKLFHDTGLPPDLLSVARELVKSFRSYAPVPDRMRGPVQLVPSPLLKGDASNFAVVLDALRDRDPDAWEQFNHDLTVWLPEFDRVLFDTPMPGARSVALRSRYGGFRVPAEGLSSGTLLVLALLTVLHADDGARFIGLEEPETGIHPRLLRNVRDALFRIAYPAENDEQREPRQIIVTTHSPNFLDLFRDTPENIVVAERREQDVQFHRLVDRADIDDILSASTLGEAWYSGLLGGVPTSG